MKVDVLWKRLVVTAVVYVIFGVASTGYYMTYIHDVGGTFWSLGLFMLPVVLFLISIIDMLLRKNRVVSKSHYFFGRH